MTISLPNRVLEVQINDKAVTRRERSTLEEITEFDHNMLESMTRYNVPVYLSEGIQYSYGRRRFI